MEASENVRWALLEHSSSIKPQQTTMTAHEPTRLAPACLCTRDQAVIHRPSGNAGFEGSLPSGHR